MFHTQWEGKSQKERREGQGIHQQGVRSLRGGEVSGRGSQDGLKGGQGFLLVRLSGSYTASFYNPALPPLTWPEGQRCPPIQDPRSVRDWPQLPFSHSCLHCLRSCCPRLLEGPPSLFDVLCSHLHSSLNFRVFLKAFLDPPSRSNCSLL